MFSRRTAQEMWTPTPMPQPITWEQFKAAARKDAHNTAQLDQIREIAKTADAETLREVIDLLCERVERAEMAARLNGDTVRSLWREGRRG
jgi:hypothetical protein